MSLTVIMTKGIKKHWSFVLEQMRIMNEKTLKEIINEMYPNGVM